ncbi:putative rpa49 subunit specific to nuclear rna polymerase i [Lyophyllum shimeji]|uniref:Rpa49 subunit specific to nuclear rna polymerase i n=1 Tax=Lyophyllum shimeji TaxID=47721 RepID=A0A9P3UQR0_LYOSH|nr:putative rpa49 subunit specific to nuclear rna polymerase i [Lyophyllum shimeji]
MSTAKTDSKKRKRESTTSEDVVLKLSAPTPGPVGPLLVSYPALQASPSTAFQCYANKKAKNDGDIDERDLLVVGETDNVEFISNEVESQRAASSGCRYLVAVHNRRTSTLNILPTPKTPYILTRTVKALKSIPVSAPTLQEYKQARTALGETFGTKKAKASIRAQERNRVDVSAMEGVMDHLQEGIDKGAAGLMTAEEAKEEADKNRLIPPFDAAATDPEDVYLLHNIIPEVEWKALSVSQFDQAGSDKERVALLPFKWSNWLNKHVNAEHEEAEPQKRRKKNLKILLYISAMLAFRQATRFTKGSTKDQITEKMNGVPSVVVDGLISRFTETARGSSSYVSTSATQTKLLTYLFALCLKVDNFASDTTVIAHDLSRPVNEINTLFKSLGCKITVLGERERARLGLPDSAAAVKRAVLNAPVQFPKPRMKRK